MKDLGIDVRFSTSTINWDGASIPLNDGDATIEEAYHVEDPSSIKESVSRLKHILDAKYDKADLPEVC
jgi:hypothetical protein